MADTVLPSLADQLAETWAICARVDLYLLEAVADDALDVQAPSKGRTVREVFVHLHNVRLMWLEVAAKDLMAGLAKLDKDAKPDGPALVAALTASARAIEDLVRRAAAAGGKVKNFKPHVGAFVGYMVAHEAHHRGQAALILKMAKRPLPKSIAYGMWEWGAR
jgi:uncharacterized damage-inducible protein DinB